MGNVDVHYETFLAPIYVWMAGGVDHAFDAGVSDLAGLTGRPGRALDLGAGFGMHAIPLARAGWRVRAVDSSRHLLAQLQALAEGLAVTTVVDDLLRFQDHVPPGEAPDLVLCMGDTLTHLPDEAAVSSLASAVAGSLACGGRFVATFRDYSELPVGTRRFIPVRSDADRILTCFLEAAGDKVLVHDILHERQGESWTTRVSCYEKLRLSRDRMSRLFSDAGLRTSLQAGPRGMVLLVAESEYSPSS